MPYVYKILGCDSSVDLRHPETIPHQGQGQLKGISVHALPYSKRRIRTDLPESLHCLFCCFFIHFLIKRDSKNLSQGTILIFDLICLVEPPKLNKRNLQPVMKILRCKPCFRMKHQIKIGL